MTKTQATVSSSIFRITTIATLGSLLIGAMGGVGCGGGEESPQNQPQTAQEPLKERHKTEGTFLYNGDEGAKWIDSSGKILFQGSERVELPKVSSGLFLHRNSSDETIVVNLSGDTHKFSEVSSPKIKNSILIYDDRNVTKNSSTILDLSGKETRKLGETDNWSDIEISDQYVAFWNDSGKVNILRIKDGTLVFPEGLEAEEFKVKGDLIYTRDYKNMWIYRDSVLLETMDYAENWSKENRAKHGYQVARKENKKTRITTKNRDGQILSDGLEDEDFFIFFRNFLVAIDGKEKKERFVEFQTLKSRTPILRMTFDSHSQKQAVYGSLFNALCVTDVELVKESRLICYNTDGEKFLDRAMVSISPRFVSLLAAQSSKPKSSSNAKDHSDDSSSDSSESSESGAEPESITWSDIDRDVIVLRDFVIIRGETDDSLYHVINTAGEDLFQTGNAENLIFQEGPLDQVQMKHLK